MTYFNPYYASVELATEALLQALLAMEDGASRAYVARRYGFSESYLSMVRSGSKSKHVRDDARAIYRECRHAQLTRST